MKYQEIENQGGLYKWTAYQDSEHPDFVLQTENGYIFVQIELSDADLIHNEKYFTNKELYPFSDSKAELVVKKLIQLGYIDTYFKTDVGLILTDQGDLIEN